MDYVIASTLVIVAVFVPLTMLTGMAGIMFKELDDFDHSNFSLSHRGHFPDTDALLPNA